jgi:hypothetical protein
LVTIREGAGVVKAESFATTWNLYWAARTDVMRAVLAACIVLLLDARSAASRRPARRGIARRQSRPADAGPAFQRSRGRVRAGACRDPNNDEVRIQYATCLFAQERNDEARKQFEIERQRWATGRA